MCVPGCTVEECFAGRPPAQREIYDAVMDHLTMLGPVHADVVRVGVFLKHESKFAELRPKVRSLSLALVLPRVVDDARIARSERISVERVANFLKLTSVVDLDEQLLDWLSEAYDAAG